MLFLMRWSLSDVMATSEAMSHGSRARAWAGEQDCLGAFGLAASGASIACAAARATRTGGCARGARALSIGVFGQAPAVFRACTFAPALPRRVRRVGRQ